MTVLRLRSGRRLLAAGLVGVATVAATTLAAPASTAATATTSTTTSVTASPALGTSLYESRVQHWINVRRAQHGLGALRFSRCTDRVAERWGDHLATTDTFVHQSMYTIMDRCGANYAGETLGRGAISPRHLVYLWMHSPEHRVVLLSTQPRRIGIGAYPNRFGEWVVAADFMRY